MGRPHREPAHDTRGQILAAALDLFAAQGYQAAGMRAIAEAAGVRQSTLYHYYPGKEALFAALIEAQLAPAPSTDERHAVEPDAPLPPLEEALLVLGQKTHAELASPTRRRLLRALLTAPPELLATLQPPSSTAPMDPWRRLSDESRRALARLLRTYRRAGLARDDLDTEALHLQFLGPLLLASNAVPTGRKIALPAQRFLRQHAAFLARLLSPAPPTPRKR